MVTPKHVCGGQESWVRAVGDGRRQQFLALGIIPVLRKTRVKKGLGKQKSRSLPESLRTKKPGERRVAIQVLMRGS